MVHKINVVLVINLVDQSITMKIAKQGKKEEAITHMCWKDSVESLIIIVI